MNAPIAGPELEGEPGGTGDEAVTQQLDARQIAARAPGLAGADVAGSAGPAGDRTDAPAADAPAAGQPAAGQPAADTARPPTEAMAWAQRNWVTLAAVALILLSLWAKGEVLVHAWFRQDDFFLFDWALANHLSMHFLWTNYTGHLMPGGLALAWALARISLYDWALASIVTIGLLAGASFALLRLLRLIFGSRPAILIPLSVYLFSMLGLAGLTFWSSTINWVPTQLAVFMAAGAHVTYLRSGRFRHAVLAAVWVAFGLLFDEADIFIPVLLLALTSAFFAAGPWPGALLATIRQYWRAFVLYLGLCAVYAGVFLHQLHTSSLGPAKPGPFSNVLTLGGTLIRTSFVPSALGGPWRWLSNGQQAFAIETPVLTDLTWLVAIVIIGASLWYRRHAWRAWIVMAGWIFLTALAPLAVGRIGLGANPALLGTDLHYLADSLPVLAICLGLAFWPVAGEQNAYRAHPPVRVRRLTGSAVFTAFLVGAVVSYSTMIGSVSGDTQSSYIATAQAAMKTVPAGSVILSTAVPSAIELPFIWGRYGLTDELLGVLAPPAQHLRFTGKPSGVMNLLTFDSLGRLWAVRLQGGQQLRPPASLHGCWPVGTAVTRIPLHGSVFHWSWEISLTYFGPASTLAVGFGGAWHDYPVPTGAHTLWVPAPGQGNAVQLQLLDGSPKACVSSLAISSAFGTSTQQLPVPYLPIPG